MRPTWTAPATCGTQARAAGVHRLVFVSSGSTIGEEEGEVGTETTERRDYALSDYERSKVEAEAALLEDRSPLDVVVVNPGPSMDPATPRARARH